MQCLNWIKTSCVLPWRNKQCWPNPLVATWQLSCHLAVHNHPLGSRGLQQADICSWDSKKGVKFRHFNARSLNIFLVRELYLSSKMYNKVGTDSAPVDMKFFIFSWNIDPSISSFQRPLHWPSSTMQISVTHTDERLDLPFILSNS